MTACLEKTEKSPIVLELTDEDRTLVLDLASWRLAGDWEEATRDIDPDNPLSAILQGIGGTEATVGLIRLLAAGKTLEGDGLADREDRYELILRLVRDAREKADALAGARARDLRLLAEGGPHRYRDLPEPPTEEEARGDYQSDLEEYSIEADRVAALERKINAFGTALYNRHYGYEES